jgi:hypothetical protein
MGQPVPRQPGTDGKCCRGRSHPIAPPSALADPGSVQAAPYFDGTQSICSASVRHRTERGGSTRVHGFALLSATKISAARPPLLGESSVRENGGVLANSAVPARALYVQTKVIHTATASERPSVGLGRARDNEPARIPYGLLASARYRLTGSLGANQRAQGRDRTNDCMCHLDHLLQLPWAHIQRVPPTEAARRENDTPHIPRIAVRRGFQAYHQGWNRAGTGHERTPPKNHRELSEGVDLARPRARTATRRTP